MSRKWRNYPLLTSLFHHRSSQLWYFGLYLCRFNLLKNMAGIACWTLIRCGWYCLLGYFHHLVSQWGCSFKLNHPLTSLLHFLIYRREKGKLTLWYWHVSSYCMIGLHIFCRWYLFLPFNYHTGHFKVYSEIVVKFAELDLIKCSVHQKAFVTDSKDGLGLHWYWSYLPTVVVQLSLSVLQAFFAAVNLSVPFQSELLFSDSSGLAQTIAFEGQHLL